MEGAPGLQQAVNALQAGALYAILALGYSMVYGVARIVNFAHGDFYMVGAFSALGASLLPGCGPWSALAAAMVAGSLAAWATDRVAYRPLRDRPRLAALVAAIGVSLFLEYGSAALPFIGPTAKPFPDLMGRPPILALGLRIPVHAVVDMLAALVLTAGLWAWVRHTATGRALRAVAMDREAAMLMGIDPERVVPLAFLAGGALAGAAGFLAASAHPSVHPFMGVQPGLKAFIAAVLGGIGSIPGAILGALLLGFAETFATAWNSMVGEGAAFLLLIVVLLSRPSGILGEAGREKL